MLIRWTEGAATELERIAGDLFVHAPDRASRLVKSIYEAPETFVVVPASRAPWEEGRHARTGAFAVPWIMVYAVRDDLSCTSSASCTERSDGHDD